MSRKKNPDSRLVSETIGKLRELILANEPETCLGSMHEVAAALGVGIVTIQQSARILEHEGLLQVRRGPGGGYYGTRPGGEALERAFATYLRVHNISYREAFEMTVSLDCDLAEAAARSDHPELEQQINTLIDELNSCESGEDRIEFEVDFRGTLFGIVNNPLLELLAHVAMQLYKAESSSAYFADQIRLDEWRTGRMQILQAILKRDSELAYFEAQRYRRQVRSWMQRHN
jgi:DNA-binding FadR family transcriptional regulator